MVDVNICPKCGAPLGEEETTPTGKRLRRCSKGKWNQEMRRAEGCPFVKWLPIEPEILEEKCPKCGKPLVMAITRFGKKMKKCSTAGWDRETRLATGCDYIEWIKGTSEPLEEKCPKCGELLVLYTTAAGKRMKKCSTAGWDKEARKPTGCPYVEWLKQEGGGRGKKSLDDVPPPTEADR